MKKTQKKSEIKRICVFCGAKSGLSPVYEMSGFKLGQLMAQNGIELVYGAGGVGVMGAVASGIKNGGGKITGMTLERLFERERPDLTDMDIDTLKVFSHMFTRKVAMTKAADAFCILPGGFGTMDELFELLVLRQLGIIDKPIVVLNINYFYDNLQALIHQLIRDEFVSKENDALLGFVNKVEDILPEIERQLKERKQ